jgi:CBS domain-containing protein
VDGGGRTGLPSRAEEEPVLVRELLTRDVASVEEDSALDVAVQVLAARHISALPVVDAGERVVGILSEADVLRLHVGADPRARLRPVDDEAQPWPLTVREVMSADPVVAHAGSDVAAVAQVLADTGWKSLPVVDDHGCLVGIVSRSDIIGALSASDSDISQHLEREFAELGRPEWTASVSRGVVTIAGVGTGREARLARAVAATGPGVRAVVVDTVAGESC